jgi:hypothetical protein
MTPSELADYGAPYNDEGPVDNPETQMSSAYGNKMCEHLSQLTRPAFRAVTMFDCVANAATYVIPEVDVTVRSLWGIGTAYKPTVTKTATGRYTIEFASSYADGLGVSENVAFIDGFVKVRTTTETDTPTAKLLTLNSTTATIAVYDAGSLDDIAASTDPIHVMLTLL